MKKTAGILIFFAAMSLHAEGYSIDKSHSRIGFKIAHLGISSVNGSFDSFGGSFDFNPQAGTLSNFKVMMDPSSINTSDAKRDTHLKGEDFFDVKKI